MVFTQSYSTMVYNGGSARDVRLEEGEREGGREGGRERERELCNME